MINSPSLLIADEPTTALDCVVQAQILELLRNIHRTKGTSILFISHDLNVVRALCSRVIVVIRARSWKKGRRKTSFCIRSMNIRAIWWRRFRREKKGKSSGGEICA